MVAASGPTDAASSDGRHLVSIRDLSRTEIDVLLDDAQRQAKQLASGEPSEEARGRVLATLFYEPSTRTRLSFESAMVHLGGRTISVSDVRTSSVAKGESLADTVRVVGGYADALVLRHPKEGASRLAARFSPVPVINAGDGAGEHPTQTLTDLYTIREAASKIEGATVVLAGDLRYGRTVHSLVLALALFGAKLRLVAAGDLHLPERLRVEAEERGAEVEIADDLANALQDADVLYQTRIQEERLEGASARPLRVTLDTLREAPARLKVLHPLPRIDEIDPEVDATDHAAYFQQARNGLPVRMAVLRYTLGGIE